MNLAASHLATRRRSKGLHKMEGFIGKWVGQKGYYQQEGWLLDFISYCFPSCTLLQLPRCFLSMLSMLTSHPWLLLVSLARSISMCLNVSFSVRPFLTTLDGRATLFFPHSPDLPASCDLWVFPCLASPSGALHICLFVRVLSVCSFHCGVCSLGTRTLFCLLLFLCTSTIAQSRCSVNTEWTNEY